MTKNIGISGTPEEIKIIGTLLELEGFAKGRCREQECVYLVTYNSKMYDSFDTKDTSCGILINKKEFKASEFDQAYQYLFNKELFSTEYFIKNTRKCISTPTFEEFIKIISLYNSNMPLKTFTENEINTTFYPYSNGYGDIEYANKKKDAIIPAWFVLKFKSEKMNKVKKIIGYKLKDEKYRIPALNISKAVNPGATKENYSDGTIMRTSGISVYFKELGLLDTWFIPVYEQEEIILNIGNPRQKVIINSNGVSCDEQTMEFSSLRRITDKFIQSKLSISETKNWMVEVTEIKIGCSTFNMEEFNQVLQASKKFMS